MRKTIDIYLVQYEGAMASAVAGVCDLFTLGNRFSETALFNVSVIGTNATVPSTLSGNSFLFLPPSIDDCSEQTEQNLVHMVSQWHQHGVIIAANCAAVFWLADAGLLNNKIATTHWNLLDKLESNYPLITAVDRQNMVVDQGDVITAAGLYAFQDLVLYILGQYSTFEVAKQVADYALLDIAGRLQSYYQRFNPDFTHGDALVLAAQRYCQQHSIRALTVTQLASAVNSAERTLSRRFQQALHMTPSAYLQQLKIEASKQQLETTPHSLEFIAEQMGYNDLSNFVRAFKRITGITPAEFRSRQKRKPHH